MGYLISKTVRDTMVLLTQLKMCMDLECGQMHQVRNSMKVSSRMELIMGEVGQYGLMAKSIVEIMLRT